MNPHCGKSRSFRHDHRWTRSDDQTTRTRWVHGWFVTIRGTATKAWEDQNSFVLVNCETTDEDDPHEERIMINRFHISSVSAAMTQALAMVCALRGLNLGVREPHAPPKEKRT